MPYTRPAGPDNPFWLESYRKVPIRHRRASTPDPHVEDSRLGGKVRFDLSPEESSLDVERGFEEADRRGRKYPPRSRWGYCLDCKAWTSHCTCDMGNQVGNTLIRPQSRGWSPASSEGSHRETSLDLENLKELQAAIEHIKAQRDIEKVVKSRTRSNSDASFSLKSDGDDQLPKLPFHENKKEAEKAEDSIPLTLQQLDQVIFSRYNFSSHVGGNNQRLLSSGLKRATSLDSLRSLASSASLGRPAHRPRIK